MKSVRIELNKQNTIDWLSEGYTKEQAADNTEEYRDALAIEMSTYLGLDYDISIEWNDGLVGNRISADSDEDRDNIQVVYDKATDYLGNNIAEWIPEYE